MGVSNLQECHALNILLNNYYKLILVPCNGWKSLLFEYLCTLETKVIINTI